MSHPHECNGVPLLPRAEPEPGPPLRAEPDVLLVLRPLKRDVPVDQRLKQLLKVALRRCGFRLRWLEKPCRRCQLQVRRVCTR